jgi:hypothetical protein
MESDPGWEAAVIKEKPHLFGMDVVEGAGSRRYRKEYCSLGVGYEMIFFLEAFCDISYRLGRITHFGVFSNAFPGLKMWVTFACTKAIFLAHFIISIAVLENVPPDAGLQKRATFPH